MDVKIILKKSSTTKTGENIPSGFSMSAIYSFKDIENKNDVCKSKDCMKKFCESLRGHAIKNPKFCYICRETFKDKNAADKKHRKVRDHCHYTGEYRGAAHVI